MISYRLHIPSKLDEAAFGQKGIYAEWGIPGQQKKLLMNLGERCQGKVVPKYHYLD